MASCLFSEEKYFKIVVLAPHCDDEVLGCGGYLLKCLNTDCQISIIYFTTNFSSVTDIRKEEAIKAWHSYKNIKQIFLQYEDSTLYNELYHIVKQLSAILEKLQPEAIFLPWPIDAHIDHQAIYDILLRICIPTSVTNIYFYEVFYPLYANCSIDITNVFDQKQEMLNQFSSQKKLNLNSVITALNQYRAATLRLKSIKYAESFYRISPNNIYSISNVLKKFYKSLSSCSSDGR